MKIRPDRYTLQDRNLNFEVVDGFDFSDDNTCFFLRGGNGFGKTSFLEKIIIPAIKAARHHFLYIGQDIRTQLYTLRALLSIQGHKVAGADEYELLKLWVEQGRSARIFILDEFDKYFPDYNFIFEWSRPFIQSYVIVTHNHFQPTGNVARDLTPVQIRFELIDFDGRIKNIWVRKE
jgi:hypothetical protein